MEIRINDIADIRSAARQFIDNLPADSTVIAFYGSMGAGKTIFIKAICRELGVEDEVTSPTFAIVNEYQVPLLSPLGGKTAPTTLPSKKRAGGTVIFHFDFYRIKRMEEAYDIGFDDYLDSGNLCFIEWPELIEDLLPENTTRVTIKETEDGARIVSF